MRSHAAVRLAWTLFGVTAVCLLVNLVVAVLNTSGPDPVSFGAAVGSSAFYLTSFAFTAVGVVIAVRRPRNPIGWILMAIGFVWELPSEEVVRYGAVTAPGSVPGSDVLAVLTSSAWVPGIGLIGTFLLLLFPDGHLPSRRWRPVAWVSALTLSVVTVAIPLLPLSLREVAAYSFLPTEPNPLGVAALAPVAVLSDAVLLAVPLCIITCAVSVVVRFRRARGVERQQLKWLAVAGVVTAVVYLLVMVLSLIYGGMAWNDETTPAWLDVVQNLFVFVLIAIPVAVGIAILRYRLYDIDRIINRALVYGGLTVALAVVYLTGVLGVGAVVRAVSGQQRSDLVVAASTLLVAGLFAPLRRRMQALIDRRFYRRRYDAQQAAGRFAVRVRDKVDLTALQTDLVHIVTTTIQPSTVSLWVRPVRAVGASRGGP